MGGWWKRWTSRKADGSYDRLRNMALSGWRGVSSEGKRKGYDVRLRLLCADMIRYETIGDFRVRAGCAWTEATDLTGLDWIDLAVVVRNPRKRAFPGWNLI